MEAQELHGVTSITLFTKYMCIIWRWHTAHILHALMQPNKLIIIQESRRMLV